MAPSKILPLTLVLSLCASACATPPPLVPSAAESERRAYVECAVRTAFLAPQGHAIMADLLARAAMAACEPQRLALLEGLARDLDGAPDPARAAAAHLEEIDAALSERLALRLYQRAVRDLTSGGGTGV